jgi:hypothetical protein
MAEQREGTGGLLVMTEMLMWTGILGGFIIGTILGVLGTIVATAIYLNRKR